MRLDSIHPPRDLSYAVASRESLDRLHLLQAERRDGPLATLPTWDDVRLRLDEIGVKNEAADAPLRTVLVAAKQSPDESWHDILMFLFWRPLVRHHHALRRLDMDPDELDTQIGWSFLHVLHRLDLDQRTVGIGKKILNDVQHDVRQHYARERAEAGRLVHLLDDDDDADVADGVHAPGVVDTNYAAADNRHDRDWVRSYLKTLVQRGRISGQDYLIIVGVLLYSRTLREMAARLGLTYEAARKRRQRTMKMLAVNENACPRGRGADPLHQ